ncbi:kinase-like protein [Atractiella rhizophila]|nr:kinase-like protein [Atractiella rhizophila]
MPLTWQEWLETFKPHVGFSMGPFESVKGYPRFHIRNKRLALVNPTTIVKMFPKLRQKNTKREDERATVDCVRMGDFVKANTSVPAPAFKGEWEFGNNRFVAMELIPGVPLADCWLEMSEEERKNVMQQLAGYLHEVRTKLRSDYIGRPNRQQGYYPYINSGAFWGPFETEKQLIDHERSRCFVKWPSTIVQQITRLRLFCSFNRSKTDQGLPSFVFSHCDLNPYNILVENGSITGIIDWEWSGYYPEWMEYASIRNWGQEHPGKQYDTYLLEALEPYPAMRTLQIWIWASTLAIRLFPS